MSDGTSTEKKRMAFCAIHGHKPLFCAEYPKVDQYVPPECTYTFNGSERRGVCECGVGACCAVPRVDGEPGAPAMPALAGGKPCKHLAWQLEVDMPLEKKASSDTPYTLPDLQDLVGGTRDS